MMKRSSSNFMTKIFEDSALSEVLTMQICVCQFIEFDLNVPRKSPTITSHSSLCFKRTIVNLKPFDSS